MDRYDFFHPDRHPKQEGFDPFLLDRSGHASPNITHCRTKSPDVLTRLHSAVISQNGSLSHYQSAIRYSKLTIETLEQGLKYVQS